MRYFYLILFIGLPFLGWAQDPVEGVLNHTNDYLRIQPYSSSYKESLNSFSHARLFYDGNNKEIRFWNSDANTQFTNLNIGSLRLNAVGDGKTLLTFDSERPWIFKQVGNGPQTRLVLQDLTGGKRFDINSKDDVTSFFFSPEYGTSYFRGNMGIGTTAPQEKLHVDGNIRGNRPGGAIRVQTEHGYLDLGAQNNGWAHLYTDRDKFIFNKSVYAIGGYSSYNGANLELQTSGNTKLSIEDDSGNVGIGTNSPTAKLDIRSVGDGQQLLKFSMERTWAFHQQGTGPQTALVLRDISGGKHFRINSHANETAFFFSPSDGKSFFKGDMGIGTTNTAGYKLSVNGKIRADEVKVYTGWADHVFKEGYQLRSIKELESYIKLNGHLPNVPSEENVLEEGINVGEMNSILLEKIEELSLYVIELKKQVDLQNQVIEELKNNI